MNTATKTPPSSAWRQRTKVFGTKWNSAAMPIAWTTNSIAPTSAPTPLGMSANRPREADTAYDVAVRLTAKISGPSVTAPQ